MTTILYNGHELAADNKVVRKEHDWNMHWEYGKKLFVNEDKTVAFTLVGATVPDHELKDIFSFLERVLSAYEQTLNKDLLKCDDITYFDDRTVYIITANNFYTAVCTSTNRRTGKFIIHETEKPRTSHGTGNAPAMLMMTRKMPLVDIYQMLGKVDYLTSTTFDSVSHSDLKPFVNEVTDHE